MSPLRSTIDIASTRGRISFRAALLMLLLLGLQAASTWPALAAMSAEERRRFQCFGCHVANARVYIHPRTGERKEISIDIAALRAADHGGLACQECHVKGFNFFPHFGKKILGCMDCHPREAADAKKDEPYDFPRIEREFESTLHFTNHPQKFGCAQCHHPHYFKATAGLGPPQAILDAHNEWCLTCHADEPEQAPDTIADGLADPAEPDLVAAHAMIPHPATHLRRSRCVDCHSGTEHAVSHTLPARGEAGSCVGCHALESAQARLYRYVGEVRAASGFTNPAIMRDSYVMGATRYMPLDVLAYVVVGGSLLAVLAHAAMRLMRRLSTARGERPSR
jgi:hypothetical protein